MNFGCFVFYKVNVCINMMNLYYIYIVVYIHVINANSMLIANK